MSTVPPTSPRGLPSGSLGLAAVDVIVGVAVSISAALLLAWLAGAGNRILLSGAKETAVYAKAVQALGTIAYSLASSRYSRVQTWDAGVLFPSRIRLDRSGAPVWDQARALFLEGARLEIADRPWDWSTGPPCKPGGAGCAGWEIRTLMDGVISFTASRAPGLRLVSVTAVVSTPAGEAVSYDLSVHPEH